jgi:lambda repressor-like predicted transcriptional regulator
MSNQSIDFTADAVSKAITGTGRTKTWVSDQTGIPYSTLNRKLAGKADFTFSELLLIAETLGVSPAAFTPPQFARAEAAEAVAS